MRTLIEEQGRAWRWAVRADSGVVIATGWNSTAQLAELTAKQVRKVAEHDDEKCRTSQREQQ